MAYRNIWTEALSNRTPYPSAFDAYPYRRIALLPHRFDDGSTCATNTRFKKLVCCLGCNLEARFNAGAGEHAALFYTGNSTGVKF